MVAKAAALRLQEGDVVKYGDHKIPSKQAWTRQGRVLRVTSKGGVLVRYDRRQDEWVPYHRINSVVSRKAETHV